MKIDRMLYIITYLLNHKRAKAQNLADKFEVSIRTIYRDIDAISQAGIPIITYQGMNGGIGIVEDFKIANGVLKNEELRSIIAGLKGINSINQDLKINMLIEKLTAIVDESNYITGGSEIMIDLSSWNKMDKIALKLQQLKDCIRNNKVVQFSYYSNNNFMVRKVEPYIIVFKDTNWYLYSFCLNRNDFRLFKIKKIKNLEFTDLKFTPREFTLDKVEWDNDKNKHVEKTNIKLIFNKKMRYIVDDIFGDEKCEVLEDGSVKVIFMAPVNKWLFGFLLGFGSMVEVLEPESVRNDIKNAALEILSIYKDMPI